MAVFFGAVLWLLINALRRKGKPQPALAAPP
jgi:hypothetical protein